MEQRWDFLAPWTEVLRTHIKYCWPKSDEAIWAFKRRSLEVYPPARFKDSTTRNYERSLSEAAENDFQATIQKFREALALLAAVVHVDQSAWRYLLGHQCGVDLGVEGEEIFEEEIAVLFQLYMIKGDTRYSFPQNLEQDLVRWFGVYQRTEARQEYLDALQKISDLAGNLPLDKPRVDIKTSDPSDGVRALQAIWNAEKLVTAEWEIYDWNMENKVESGSLRCTFVMEPMILDFGERGTPFEYVELVIALVQENVWFSQVSLWMGQLGMLFEVKGTSKLTFGELMMTLFNTPQQPYPMNRIFASDGKAERESSPLQLGTIDLDCDHALRCRDFQSMCSAIVANQTAKNVSMHLCISTKYATNSGESWKWLAYAFFSKRAREYSSLECLAFTSVDSMTVEDMEAFSAIVASGRVEEREATLKAYSEIHWDLDDQGQPWTDSIPISLDKPIPSVRTFSDDGESTLVNVMIPGFGWCQVQRSDLVFAHTTSVRASSRGVTSLTLSFPCPCEVDHEGLPKFLAAVGRPLRFLSLKEDSLQLDDRVIFQCCPNLDEFALCRHRVEARLSFCDYRATHQGLPELGCDWDDVRVLLTRLTDNSSPLAQCVRRLRQHLYIWMGDWDRENGANEATPQDAINVIHQMLEINKSLEYFDAVAPMGYLGDVSGLRKHHLKPMMRLLKLPIDAKVALLSVIFPQYAKESSRKRKHEENISLSSLGRLDENVLSKIFLFAAPPLLRRVYTFKPTRDTWEYSVPVPI
ncbi:hypothetical protein PHYSODRAFT_306247 [Phytophthora sojae]|uniref:Uncharacterized protein n=1 Tax=Phytophthora sojae (strain P6497) TaxID=1094619 RepID=G5A8L5_PHYSP|nr:hypothetical protein PHYSODRAFT_306247 [Phytophthora sojae]EGZ08241.1 hypothetical protein PHYSODRAFT_306247 [Phytophthora sojae]|eukprot:XP_009536413.1 hypothetical protein PHYSODRAFT_306247 [Phytophthora sojae]